MGYYKESGKINVLFTLLAFVFGAGVVVLLAYGYSFVTDLNPFIYINFIITGIYVLILGVILGLIRQIGKMRNFPLFLSVGLVLSAIGLYAVWVSYISIVFNKDFVYGMSHFQHAIDVLSNRSYSIGRAFRSNGLELSGGMLYFLWIVEALILFLAPLFFIFHLGKDDQVYCEDCDQWAENEKVYLRKAIPLLSKEDLEAKINQHKVQDLLEMTESFQGDSSYFEIKFTSCKKCHQAYYLSVKYILNQKNSKGVSEKTEKLILPFYELDKHHIPRQILDTTTL